MAQALFSLTLRRRDLDGQIIADATLCERYPTEVDAARAGRAAALRHARHYRENVLVQVFDADKRIVLGLVVQHARTAALT